MKTNDKNIRKLTRAGKFSIAVTLPIDMLKDLGWHEKQRVVATRAKGGILIRGYKAKN